MSFFTLAKPALEKAHEINPEDRNTIASLIKIYAIEGDDDKYLEMKKKIVRKEKTLSNYNRILCNYSRKLVALLLYLV